MERLTYQEWTATVGALQSHIERCWRDCARAWELNLPDIAQEWADRVVWAKSAFDKIAIWPWTTDEWGE